MEGSSRKNIGNYLKDKNFIVSLITIVFSLYFIVTTKKTSSNYPYIIFFLMLGLAVVLLVTTVVKKKFSPADRMSLSEIIFMAVLVINPVFTDLIGFYVSAFIEVFVISLFLARKRTGRELVKIFVFSLLVIAFSYVVFTYGLRIRCPDGALSLI